jgi:hypothetical protein
MTAEPFHRGQGGSAWRQVEKVRCSGYKLTGAMARSPRIISRRKIE